MGKPYSFIPFLKTSPYKVNNEKLYRGKINLKIEVLNAVHISMGEYDIDSSGDLFKEFFKINEKYAIPGTSVKGMVRSIAEMISNSCISTSNKTEANSLPSYKKTSCKRELCIICDIFGAMGRKSKIKVSDFIYEEGTGKSAVIGMPKFRPPKIGQSYMDNDVLRGYKYYNHGIESIIKKGDIMCECLLKGAQFSGSIIYENLDSRELCLLCYALGLTNGFNNKIGYGKPAYYGSIRVTAQEEYVKYAETYKENSAADVRKNIDILEKVYSYKNANKVPDYEGIMY